MDWRSLAVLAHVLGAFWFMAGYIGTNVCTEVARRSQNDGDRRAALLSSNVLDRRLNQTGGAAVGLTGIGAMWVLGYPLGTPWIVASAVLLVGVVGLGITYWGRFGRRIDAAVAADNWAVVKRLLNEPWAVLASRVENLAVLALIVLMVLRPA